MSTMMTVTKTRLQRLLDERVTINKLHEDLVAGAEQREGNQELTDAEQAQAEGYRNRQAQIDKEVGELHDVLKREEESAGTSKLVRAHLAGQAPGVISENGEVVYQKFSAFARDNILTRFDHVAAVAGGEQARLDARERLMRAPAHTLSSGVPGLIPPQHIAQIMQVIDKSRPVVQTARRVDLERGRITFPRIDTRPAVLQQTTEKTEGGTVAMAISLQQKDAVTFNGGGNLSWQAINWSTPSALDLWFDLAAEQYAKKTEVYACQQLIFAGTASGTISSPISGTADFATWISGVVRGMEAVYTASGAMADTLYVSPDRFFLAASLVSSVGANFIDSGGLSLGGMGGRMAGLNVVASPGLGTATVIVGDSNALLVAETPGSPVELRAVEPAIGGMEVGIIGALAVVAVENGRFRKIST